LRKEKEESKKGEKRLRRHILSREIREGRQKNRARGPPIKKTSSSCDAYAAPSGGEDGGWNKKGLEGGDGAKKQKEGDLEVFRKGGRVKIKGWGRDQTKK